MAENSKQRNARGTNDPGSFFLFSLVPGVSFCRPYAKKELVSQPGVSRVSGSSFRKEPSSKKYFRCVCDRAAEITGREEIAAFSPSYSCKLSRSDSFAEAISRRLLFFLR